MSELTLRQQEDLASMRSDVINTIEDYLGIEIRLLMFTFYPISRQYGCSVALRDRVYFGKGESIDAMINDLVRAKTAEVYILPSMTIFERQRV
jgi:hypothetical protein